jgi:transcriptional regulator with XRE-family HTH domain
MPKQRPGDENNVLRSIRQKRNLTQKQAAERCNYSRNAWSAWELRVRPLTVAQLNRIELALSLTEKENKAIRKWWGDHCDPKAEQAEAAAK